MAVARPLDRALCERAELLNLGAGTGRWLLQEARRCGVERPLGIERNSEKVAKAQALGIPVYEADFTELNPTDFPSVKVVVLDNVLEHLESLDAVEETFALACTIASHLVCIRHPSFEHEEYLASLGLKQYWNDWPDTHRTHVRLHEFVAMATRNDIYRFTVHPVKRAYDSADPTILPLGAPPDQKKQIRNVSGAYGVYDADLHGPKPSVTFDRPVYFAFDLLFFRKNELASLVYPSDTEQGLARPSLQWHGPSDGGRGRASQRLRRRARRVANSVTRRSEERGQPRLPR